MTIRWPLRTAVTTVTLLALAAGSLRAQNSLDTAFAVSARPRLSVQSQSGTVEVRGWSRSQIRVQAEYDKARVEFDAAGSQVTVRTVHRRGSGEADYTISVPAGTAVEVNGMSVDVDINGVCGPVNLNAISGDMQVRCIEGDGQIQTVSGDVSVSDSRGRIEIGTTSGEIDLRGARGPVTVHAVSGDITLADIAGNEVDAETVSGDVEYSGRILDGGRYRFAAHSGDVTVYTTGNPNASISVSTFNGDFSSDFQIEIRPGSRVSREWEFQIGTGSARVRLASFSGSINLHRGTGSTPRER